MIYILAFSWVLGILIFVHELGHLIAAKLVGVKVLKFSFGFGPKLIGRKIGETEYMISAIPLGGYVKPLGEEPRVKVTKEEQGRAFLNQPACKRAAIVTAGPLANFMFGAFIFSLLFWIGMPQPTSVVGEVVDKSPAHAAGIQPRDKIIRINDIEITNWYDIPMVVSKSKGKELQVTIKRGEEIIRLRVTPRAVTVKNIFGEEIKTYQIGVGSSAETMLRREPLHRALVEGVYETWFFIKMTVVGIIKTIQQVIPAKQALGGPILIFQVAGEQAKKGFLDLLLLTAVLSVNVGLINLFPIPILDGGHLLFLGIETIIRRPLNVKKMELAQQIGLFIILLLVAFIFYNDIMRLLPQGAK